MPPRVLIFGTGSIGAVYTWILSRVTAPHDITAICRSNYDAASERGFTINSTLWGNELRVKPVVARSIAEAVESAPGTPFDYVVVTAKALQTSPSLAETIRPAISQQTTIVLIQNGIGIEDEYAALYPSNPLLSTVVYLPATQTSPGIVEHKEIELLHVGTYPDTAPAKAKNSAKAFVELLTQAGATAKLHDDVQSERWGKLLVNASWNPICALTRLRDRQLIDTHEEALDFVRDVMLEICAVAQACGYAGIDMSLVDVQISRARARALPGVQPSMQADAMAGRTLEVEAIVGNAVRVGKKRGIKTPLLRSIYIMAKGLSDSFGLEQA